VPAVASRPELLNGTITAAIGWLRAHLEPLRAAGEAARVVGEAAGRTLTFGQARQLVALREAADSGHAQLAARDAIFGDLCGPLYAGAATNLMALREGLEWARRLRTMITGGAGPLTPGHLHAAESAVPAGRLASTADAWQQASAALLEAFSPHRRPELAAELDDYQAGAQLLEAMFNDPSGPGEWHAYQAARAGLATHGLDAAVGCCITEQVQAAQVPLVIERALLQEWADHQVRTDPALAPLRAAGRDALVSKYQRLDRALMAAAAGGIIRACDARSPGGDAGEFAVIRREAAKHRNHLPVRDLLGQTRHLTQALKPCFLMPPLTARRGGRTLAGRLQPLLCEIISDGMAHPSCGGCLGRVVGDERRGGRPWRSGTAVPGCVLPGRGHRAEAWEAAAGLAAVATQPHAPPRF
jgi:hypothetical protein